VEKNDLLSMLLPIGPCRASYSPGGGEGKGERECDCRVDLVICIAASGPAEGGEEREGFTSFYSGFCF